MRELELPDACYFAGLVAISLLLPLLMSFRAPREPAVKRACMKVVWTGQALDALAALAVLASARLAPFALALGLASYLGCVLLLLRRLGSPAR